MGKNIQHNPAKDPVKAQDWNESVARLDDPARFQPTPEPEPVPPDTLDDREMFIPLDELKERGIFTDFSEYTAGLRHLKDGPISRMRRRSFLSGLIIGLLTSSLIWFIMLVAYGVIMK